MPFSRFSSVWWVYSLFISQPISVRAKVLFSAWFIIYSTKKFNIFIESIPIPRIIILVAVDTVRLHPRNISNCPKEPLNTMKNYSKNINLMIISTMKLVEMLLLLLRWFVALRCLYRNLIYLLSNALIDCSWIFFDENESEWWSDDEFARHHNEINTSNTNRSAPGNRSAKAHRSSDWCTQQF